MRDARRAGIYPATRAIKASSSTIDVYVAGSIGSVPKSSEAIHLATASDAAVPSATPSNVSRSVPRIMSNWTCAEVAPRCSLLCPRGSSDPGRCQKHPNCPERSDGQEACKSFPKVSGPVGIIRPDPAGHDPDRSCPPGRPHREVSFCRRRSLSFMISPKSTIGRISIGPSPYLKPGSCETS